MPDLCLDPAAILYGDGPRVSASGSDHPLLARVKYGRIETISFVDAVTALEYTTESMAENDALDHLHAGDPLRPGDLGFALWLWVKRKKSIQDVRPFGTDTGCLAALLTLRDACKRSIASARAPWFRDPKDLPADEELAEYVVESLWCLPRIAKLIEDENRARRGRWSQ